MIYESKMELIKHRVAALDSIFVKMTSLNRDVYSAVMGSSVTTVLNAFWTMRRQWKLLWVKKW